MSVAGARLEASEAGIARAAIFLGLKGALPRSWDEVHEVRLVAKALGLERESGKRLAALATPDGLRAAIVQKAFGLKIRGVATPSRLRAGLAAVALERAFGNQIKAGLAGKLGLSAKAGRLLAAQLARKPRDFGTDARLIAALAAEHVGAAQADLAALRLAVLRRYLDGPDKPAARAAPAGKGARRRGRGWSRRRPHPRRRRAGRAGRPDLAGFAQEVRRHAAGRAQGWPGNRKAYISHVWHLDAREAPRVGPLRDRVQVHADRGAPRRQPGARQRRPEGQQQHRDVQESAVVYKNAVFHFIRVDG